MTIILMFIQGTKSTLNIPIAEQMIPFLHGMVPVYVQSVYVYK